MKVVWVELNILGYPVRIFKNTKDALARALEPNLPNCVTQMAYKKAVFEIRHQVWEKTKGFCTWCAEWITEESMHMHEVLHRGQGGEISLKNSVGICAGCHMRAHEDRNPRFGEIV